MHVVFYGKKNLLRLHDEQNVKTQHTFASVLILKSTVGKNEIEFCGEVKLLFCKNMQRTVKNNFKHISWNLPESIQVLVWTSDLFNLLQETSYVSFNVYMWGKCVLTEL